MNSIAELPQNERQALQDLKSGIPRALPGCGFRLTLLHSAFEDRAEGDYGMAPVSREQADTDISAGHRFVLAVEDRIKTAARGRF